MFHAYYCPFWHRRELAYATLDRTVSRCCVLFVHILVTSSGCWTMQCRVQYLNDTDPFNCASFPEPARPIVYTFLTDVALVNQLVSLKRLLGAPHYVMLTVVLVYSACLCCDLSDFRLIAFTEDLSKWFCHKVVNEWSRMWRLHSLQYSKILSDPCPTFNDSCCLCEHMVLLDGATTEWSKKSRHLIYLDHSVYARDV